MDVGSPEPAVYEERGTAWVAYRCNDEDEYCAVLRFTGVESLTLGPPSNDRLHEHPLHDAGLEPYAFQVVEDSEEATDGETAHWIVTFGDETLEVIAEDADVLESQVDVNAPEQALSLVGR